jgi:4-carboxymuconolactone decarboxylase
MIDFAVTVSAEAYSVFDADFATLKSHGLTEDDIWDIAARSSFFGLSNRLANVTSMRPNAEFYSMGRS